MLDTDTASTLRALSEAEDAGFVQRGVEAGTYDIQPGLCREVLYEDLNTARRLELYRAIGCAFESLCDGEPHAYLAELSHHFAECAALDHGEAALRYARRAASRTLETFAYDEAAVLLRRALAATASVCGHHRELRASTPRAHGWRPTPRTARGVSLG